MFGHEADQGQCDEQQDGEPGPEVEDIVDDVLVTLLSDLNKKVASDYGVIFPGLAGIGDTAPAA